MSSEDDDYMSDKFLGQQTDVRPGLIRSIVTKKQLETESKRKNNIEEQKTKRQKVDAVKERLEEGLNNPISNDNKGYALLAKMGYKPGQALGAKSEGIVEPIGIEIKSNRSGLGREAALKQLEENKIKYKQARLAAREKTATVSIAEFRKRFTQKNEEILLQSALRKSQKACEDLDLKEGVKVPAMPWFWPEQKKEKTEDTSEESDEEEEEEEYELAEKVEMLTYYLRTSYNYCHWCGVLYQDLQDISENCPGNTKDDH